MNGNKNNVENDYHMTTHKNPLNQQYWDSQWQQHNTRWDIGYPAPAIAQYMDQYPNKKAKILIPGCGNAYEAEYLLKKGFEDITLLDIAPTAARQLSDKFTGKNAINVICSDFFMHEGQYDLLIEQTFFCAIPPEKRSEYAQQAAQLLNKDGKMAGLLFDKTFEHEGPPFGGSSDLYKSIFEPYFYFKTIDKCHNSIEPRKDAELFIILLKK